MNKTTKQKWVDALRSGNYKQTSGYLHDKYGYCCLGVLAEMCGDSDAWTGDDDGDFRYRNSFSA